MSGVALGLFFGAGVLLVAAALRAGSRAALSARVDPYIGIVAAPPAPVWIGRLARRLGSDDELHRLLAAAGRDEDALAFRIRQLVAWLGSAATVSVVVVVLRLGGAKVSIAGGLLSALLLGTAGPLVLWAVLKTQAQRRQLAVELEVPAVAALLGLSLSAGETLRASVERVASTVGGVWGEELSRALLASAGTGLSDALDSMARRLDVPAATRLVSTLQLARERGVPVADTLRAQAADLRAASTRRLIEAGGRRQVLMLAPVVFLILPVCVLFAFYPALVSLRSLTS